MADGNFSDVTQAEMFKKEVKFYSVVHVKSHSSSFWRIIWCFPTEILLTDDEIKQTATLNKITDFSGRCPTQHNIEVVFSHLSLQIVGE